MSAVAAGSGAHKKKGVNRVVLALIVSLAPFMEILDTSISNVALNHIAGSLAASFDEATWTLTSYFVANAVIVPASGWLQTTFGRKNFYLMCVAIFTGSSLMCGFAWSLPSLVFFRILQGLGGGGMAPSGQSIIADLFPPEERGTAFTIFGLAVVVAPAIGPTLGGWITDQYSWHWIFFINFPVGLAAIALVSATVPTPSSDAKAPPLRESIQRFDTVGFLLVSLGLGALEVVLDRGQTDDWFGSNFIVIAAIVSAVALAAFVPYELTRKEPLVDLTLLKQRQFGLCFVAMMVTAAILFSTTQFLPQLLQTESGYTATLAGLTLSPGGFTTMAMLPFVNLGMKAFSPKWLIAFGLVGTSAAMFHLTGLSPDISFGYATTGRVIQAFFLPFVFIPVTTACYADLPKEKTNMASGLINVARNLGGSIGVSAAQTILARREQFHQSRLVEAVAPTSPAYQAAFSHLQSYFVAHGQSAYEAGQQAIQFIGQSVEQQAAFLSYVDVFFVAGVAALLCAPLALALKK